MRYRYRTAVLVGRWRDSAEAAVEDAVAARQARRHDKIHGAIHWVVPGEIEQESADELKRRVGRH
jgi:hypothetical protein